MMKIPVSIIVAMADNRLIGKEGKLPWPHNKGDMQHFRELTMGNPIIMGRKTFQSLPNLLDGRYHIVLTRDKTFVSPDGCVEVHTFERALLVAKRVSEVSLQLPDERRIWVIGGGEVYRAALPCADEIHITRIYHYLDGDTFFPDLSRDTWIYARRVKPLDTDPPYPYRYEYQLWRRRS